MNRRKFLAMMAAGGVVTATGIWMPGQKLISIPAVVHTRNMTATEVLLRQQEWLDIVSKQIQESMAISLNTPNEKWFTLSITPEEIRT